MADEEIKRLKRTVADLRVLTDNKDREIRKWSEAYRTLQQDSDGRIQALQEQNEQFLSQLQTRHRSGSLKDLEEKLVKAEGTNQNLKKANSILREKKEAVDKQVVHMKEEVEFLRSQTESDFLPPPSPQNGASNADLQRQLTGYKAQLAKLKDDNYSLETEGRKTKRNLCLIQEECYKLQNDAERSEQYARRLKKDLEIQIQAHESLKQRPRQDIIVEDSTDLRIREEALRKNWSQLEQEKILVSEKNQELIDARQQHLKEQQQWGEEKNILTMENGELKRTIAHLERACEQLKKSKSQRSMSESQQYTTSQQASSSFSRNRSGDSVQMLLHQQTLMVATLQQQLYQVQNDLRRVEDNNTRYHKAAGNLQTTFTTLKTGTMSTDERAFELLAEKLAEILNITHQKTPKHNSSRPSVPSYSAPITSQYPKIAPFSQKTHHHVLDVTKPFPSESSDNPCCPYCSYDITTDLQTHMKTCPFRKQEQ